MDEQLLDKTELNLSFLIYDSRSGSTILSKTLAEKDTSLYVTPEIGLIQLMQCTRNFDTKNELVKFLLTEINKPAFRNVVLNQSSHEIVNNTVQQFTGKFFTTSSKTKKSKLEVNPQQFANLMIEIHLNSKKTCSKKKYILVKNGSHVNNIDRLRATLGDQTKFVFLHRDPRDVIESKLRTKRPYHDFETMAWGGVFLAAIRWKLFAYKALKKNCLHTPIHFVAYEDFACEHRLTTNRILRYLGVATSENSAKHRNVEYQIPEMETKIHSSALAGTPTGLMIGNWKNKLGKREVVTVETVCKKQMLQLGYNEFGQYSRLDALNGIGVSILESVVLIIRHYTRALIHGLRK